MARKRVIKQVITGEATTDGAGVNLTRIIGSPQLNMLDPFLLLDEFGSNNPHDYIPGFPPHPHRGFETITYMLNGKWQHKDSAGNEGVLGDGSVQWMTAGRGIIHSEMPIQTDGLARGFQLWLNLPKSKKMMKPSYADIPAEAIPIVDVPGGSVKIISGTFEGVTGPGKPHTGMLYFDVRLNNYSGLDIPIHNGWNAFIYVYEGGLTGENKLDKGQLAVLSTTGDLKIESGPEGVGFILAAGEPLNEPVARGGPFVMNTRGEILKAFSDYQEGKIGK